eukprot:TRINITY_DN76722_c0_g1_i1.p1 TRINITY_DN76722_c0_g1~~TRINITY_DN76722_c0_g1_i1.p1  ORF type:complete len:487 (+),score=153.60 TRINITY_DN76722_c0_g1_i1:76-1536(+)
MGKEEDDEQRIPLLGCQTKPKFMVNESITLRETPRLDSEHTGKILREGTEVEALDIVTVSGDDESHWDHLPVDYLCFVLVEDGWAMSRNPVTDQAILSPVLMDTSEPNSTRFQLRAFFSGRYYEMGITAIIILNAMFIWAEIDHPDVLPTRAWWIINVFFSVFYTVEITTKLVAFGPALFFESPWNVFDFVITAVTVLSDLAPLVVAAGTAKKIRKVCPVIRLLRLLRLANMFQGLRTLMRSFTSSLSALVWIAVFIIIWFFICACLTTVFMGREEFFPDSAASTPAEAQRLRKAFHSVPFSMYTLFEVMTIEGWIDVVRPIVLTQPLLLLFFFVFVFVAGFFLLNLVTAVVVDRTVQAQEEDHQAREAAANDQNQVLIYNLMTQMKAQNQEKDIIRRADLNKLLEEPEVVSQLKKVDWDPELAVDICASIDKRSSGEIDLLQLQKEISSAARPLDTMRLVRFQADLAQRLERQEKMLEQLLDAKK